MTARRDLESFGDDRAGVWRGLLHPGLSGMLRAALAVAVEHAV